MDLPLLTDRVLFKQMASGDEQAFRQIFHTYNAKLHPFVRKVTRSDTITEDIIQETFLRLWIHRSEVAQMEYPSSWLYKVASNLSLTHLRRKASETRRLQKMGSTPIATNNVTDSMSLREIQTLLSQAIDLLPPKRQYIYKLSRDQGLSYKEIAEKLQISPNTVKNQLVSALKFIKDYICSTSEIVIPILILLFFH